MSSIPKDGRAREARERAFEAVVLMRKQGLSLGEAASRVGTTPATVLKYASSALEREANGYRALPSDRLIREMVLPTAEGNRNVRVKGSRDASLVGEYWNAVREYLQSGDDARLQEFEGQSITGSRGETWELLTDRSSLRRLGNAGVLAFEDIYRASA
jgi:hypothetical protein